VSVPQGIDAHQDRRNFRRRAPPRSRGLNLVASVLYLNGWDISGAALEDRKAALAEIMSAKRSRRAALQRSSNRS
jgi:hypothetical protein